VLAPIVFLSVLLTALLVIDQEFIIPPLSDQLTRDEDDMGEETYNVYFITDTKGSLIFARKFDAGTETLYHPTILLRREIGNLAVWDSTGLISAESAAYDPNSATWRLFNGTFVAKDSNDAPEPIAAYDTDIRPQDIPVRLKAEYKTLLSWSQLRELAAQGPSKDRAQLHSQMHFRVTDPIINMAMLLVCLPILLCRDPKAMKTAIMISFGVSGACLITNFVCKMLATEVVFGIAKPELWAWMPVFIFLPLAFVVLDTMKS
jgi:lipopolysaccharide export LptBFGC system permease protein LptF